MSLYAENRARLVAALAALDPKIPEHSVIVVEGAHAAERDDSDHELLFRQESWFHWLFGVIEPGCFGIIEVDTGRSTLLFPRLPASYAVWMGEIKPPAFFQAKYEVDDGKYVDELEAILTAYAPALVLRNYGKSTDSGNFAHPAKLPGAFPTNDDILFPVFSQLRSIKTEKELDVMRYAALVSSEAHIAVMTHTKPGQFEYQQETLFKHWCYYNGACRNVSYTCICATGHNSSVLHYGHAAAPNDRRITPTDMCLFDMGGEFNCYASDITCSFPASGTFSPDQKLVYEAVLDAQWSVMDAMAPGVCWVDMHTIAYKTILTHLLAGGLLTGTVEEMMAANLGATFMPHGLGHFIGIDTHDAGGYEEGVTRVDKDGYRSLRTARVLQPNMVITVEPGCYFVDHVLDAALANPDKARFLVPDAIARFRGFGGVRLEDVVRVTEDGVENFTWCPRTVEDVEAVRAGRLTSRLDIKRWTKRT